MVIGIVPLASAQDDETFVLTIMHTNDTHAAHQPNSSGNGGVAIQAAVVQQIRASVANSLLVDAGDRFTGTLFHQQYHGQDNVQIMNLLGYDVMTLGNHEFDNGDDTLVAFAEKLNFPIVNTNIDFSGNAALDALVAPYVVLEIGGQQIGITGLITPDTPTASSPSDALVFSEDLVGTAQAAVDEMTAAGVNKIVLLTHVGYNMDVELAPQLTGVDVIVGGHSHTPLSNLYASAVASYPTELTSASGEPVLVVAAANGNEYLGRLDVEFDAAGMLVYWSGDMIQLSGYITPDPAMATLVDELAQPLEELKNTVIGETSEYLVGDRTVCRAEECNLGNLIADAVLESTGADIVIQNGGGIRADIDMGEVTMGEVLTVLPFGNLISTLNLKGEYVWAALENGVSEVEDGGGRFPQVAGLRYTWDASQAVGSRIVSVDVWNDEAGAWEPLDLEKIYYVATNDFMRSGGDGYQMFMDFAIDPYDYGSPLDAVVADYIAANSPIAPAVEGRITRMN